MSGYLQFRGSPDAEPESAREANGGQRPRLRRILCPTAVTLPLNPTFFLLLVLFLCFSTFFSLFFAFLPLCIWPLCPLLLFSCGVGEGGAWSARHGTLRHCRRVRFAVCSSPSLPGVISGFLPFFFLPSGFHDVPFFYVVLVFFRGVEYALLFVNTGPHGCLTRELMFETTTIYRKYLSSPPGRGICFFSLKSTPAGGN